MARESSREDCRTSLTLRNRLEELQTVNRAVAEFARDGDLPATERNAIELVLEELVTNAIHHGYSDEDEHEISIELRWDGEIVEIRFEDDGVPFDPTRAEDPDTESAIADRAVGGLGLHLVKNFMEDIAYAREAGRNVLTLRRNVAR